MREDDIIAQVINETEAAVPSNMEVRTEGGDQNVDPPEIVLEWQTTPLPHYAGHSAFGGFTYDNSGNKTGREYHLYSQMRIECIVRSYSENERDTTFNDIQMAFLPYEGGYAEFDPDTGEWEVGGENPRTNPVLEPDWYEATVLLEFVYLKRTERVPDADTIDTFNIDVDPDESITKNTSTTNTN